MKAQVIARFTFREAARKKVLFGAIALTVAFVSLFGVGTYFAFRDLARQGLPPSVKEIATAQILLVGLYVTNFISGLLAIFTSVGTISGEVAEGTLDAIVPKPLRRWEIVAGKWVGYAAMLVVYVFATSWLVIGLVYLFGDYMPPRPWESIMVMAFQTLVLLSLCLLGSTFLSTVTNGIVVLMFYTIALVGGMVEQIGNLLSNTTMENIGIISSLIIPSDTLWKMASHWLQPTFPSLTAEMIGPFTSLNPPSVWMLVYAGFYMLCAVGASMLIFRQRDL